MPWSQRRCVRSAALFRLELSDQDFSYRFSTCGCIFTHQSKIKLVIIIYNEVAPLSVEGV